MKIFRAVLPLYKRLIKDSSHGKGYGKNKFVRKILPFFDLINIHNKGISFGLFSENFPTWLITIIVGLVIIILIYWFF